MGGHALKLLLDTHIWLWALLDSSRLKPQVAAALNEPSNELWLSPISVWETLMLTERGRLDLGDDPRDWIESQLRRRPLRAAPLSREVALRSRSVKLDHEDPADRFLAASAAVHELTLVTADRRLWRSGEYDVLQNR